jgi:2-iminoacetate synthase
MNDAGARAALATADRGEIRAALANADPGLVDGLLRRSDPLGPRELALLLSPGAGVLLEELAIRAREIASWRHGRAIALYAPLYLSNRCASACPYCGFGGRSREAGRALTLDETVREAEHLARGGLRHLLLVGAEDPRHWPVSLMVEAVAAIRRVVPSVSVEVQPLAEDDYRALAAAGLHGVTLYQETYDEERYRALHRVGSKADCGFRLETLDRAGAAGVRSLTAGALWGLAPWRLEALRLGLHARFLQRRHWRSLVGLGLPRLSHVPPGFAIEHPVDDAAFVQLICALRIFLVDATMALSTREPAELRDRLVHLGITHCSAGSRTSPGGYTDPGGAGEQFPVADDRDVGQVAAALADEGFEPVAKDWDAGLGPEPWREACR